MDGNHTLEQCDQVTEATLHAVFDQLYRQRVVLEGMILKPNMVLPGKECPCNVEWRRVADATVQCLCAGCAGRSAGRPPFFPAVPGGRAATLNAMHVRWQGSPPWALTFFFLLPRDTTALPYFWKESRRMSAPPKSNSTIGPSATAWRARVYTAPKGTSRLKMRQAGRTYIKFLIFKVLKKSREVLAN